MRLALSSRSFARRLERGDLTQLEWIDVCCAQPGLGGVDLSHEHFPRRDAEYLAQIKKLCVDRQLTIAGLNAAIALGDDLLRRLLSRIPDQRHGAAARDADVEARRARSLCGDDLGHRAAADVPRADEEQQRRGGRRAFRFWHIVRSTFASKGRDPVAKNGAR